MNQKDNSTIFTPILIGGSLILLISFAIRSTFGLFQIPIAEQFIKIIARIIDPANAIKYWIKSLITTPLSPDEAV